MSRYIDADKLQKDGWKLERRKKTLTVDEHEVMELDAVPTADVRENVRGEWGRTKNGFIYCSNCEKTWYDNAWTDNWHYCPNCGAQMER